jgi:hypothetical protein
MASGAATVAPITQGGLSNYQDEEEFVAVLVTNIYSTDPSNKSHSRLRRDHVSFKTLESDLDQSFTFFRSSVSTYRLVEKFCGENPAFTKNLAQVKASFNPIAAFYQDPMQAWIYANPKRPNRGMPSALTPGTLIANCGNTARRVPGRVTAKKFSRNGPVTNRRNDAVLPSMEQDV